MQRTLRIATRQSQLARWQAELVQQRLQTAWPDLAVELVGLSTQGDRVSDRPLAEVGGKGLFLSELEAALENGDADIAVHSMKDVPAEIPADMALPVVLAPASPLDAFVSNHYATPADLPAGSLIGTASPRRQALFRQLRPDIRVDFVRGNVQTRLAKLDGGDFDAIVLACAGLDRLALDKRIRMRLPPEQCLPAVGQGVLGIEMRADDKQTLARIEPLAEKDTTVRIDAERAVARRLGGNCHLPIAAHGVHDGHHLTLHACVAETDGTRVVADRIDGPIAEAENLGTELADRLLAAGADAILQRLV
ncbi:hydroxymethylbilane synthase [Salinisphaera sp. USBA-960]|uniref:hydroxymethylbilane synthase n=1 Tax=Salinisphaera orenii TaxID=856731 RepID=UPI000DBE573B|nr:hydroxymethylbilane synthase [Salifodinibacter halophilus]NNC25951.1 hydroxymethylbilane synthase [Salifodinibacter halophilus]